MSKRNTGTDRCEYFDGDDDTDACPYAPVGEAEVFWALEPIRLCDCHMDDVQYVAKRTAETGL